MNNPHDNRWARYGPYYAMFPLDFAFGVIRKYSAPNDSVLDPFAGRGTSVYAAAALQRNAVGVEINPVGWIYGKTKLKPAAKEDVLLRLSEISAMANQRQYKLAATRLPEFFQVCFSPSVRWFLLASRENLNWRQNDVDRTLMSFIVYYLHNNIRQGLSNQMKQTIAMSPNYSLRWWRANGYDAPPEIACESFLYSRIQWRYENGTPQFSTTAKVLLGDSEKKLANLKTNMREDGKFSLLLTSPPYCSVLDYHSDQWLRLWLLGGETSPKASAGRNKGRFVAKQKYWSLLENVFSKCAGLMKPNSVIYVRTDVRPFTFECTQEVLKKYFPNHAQKIVHSAPEKSQGMVYKNAPSIRPGEQDIILQPLKA